MAEMFVDSAAYLERLANVSEVSVVASEEEVPKNAVRCVLDAAILFIPLDSLVDKEEEKARLTKEQKRLEGEVKRLLNKLGNECYVKKAPAEVVQGERDKLSKMEPLLNQVNEQLQALDK